MTDYTFQDAPDGHKTTLDGDEAIGATSDPSGTPADVYITPDDILNRVDGLTEDTAPDRVSDFGLSYDDSASASKKVLLKNFGAYALSFTTGSYNPADATTYFVDSYIVRTTDANTRIYIPRAGKIIACYLHVLVVGTLGTTETSTASIRLNSTSDTTISSSVAADAVNQAYNNTSLGIAVAAGDYVSIKWVTPTWATNPTSLYFQGVLFIA